MPGSVDDAVRDATSLHRFITSISRRQEPERTHRRPTEQFLEYIRQLSGNAEAFLQSFVERVADPNFDASLVKFERQGLTSVRQFWSALHEFVRPVEEAHSLAIPVALIEHLEDEISRLPNLRGSRLVISHTPELNYIQYPRTDLRYDATVYSGIVSGGPPFPESMALIAIPYSQETSLFSNLVICHELGHFAFEELALEQGLSSKINEVLRTTLTDYSGLSEPDLSWCRERLKYWSEEIYCDRFAIGLIGPAFSLAYIELFDLIGTS